MSHVPGEFVFKRYLNAIRPVGGGGPAPPPVPPFVCEDGPIWSALATMPAVSPFSVFALAYGAGAFVVLGVPFDTMQVRRTVDGLTWTSQPDVFTTQPNQSSGRSNALLYGNGIFLNRINTNRLVRSVDDGLSFQEVITASSVQPNFSCFAGGRFYFGGTNTALWTTDGDLFVPCVFVGSMVGKTITAFYEFGGFIYAVVGDSIPFVGSGRVWRSNDGGTSFVDTGVVQPWDSANVAPARIASGLGVRVGAPQNSDIGVHRTADGGSWSVSIVPAVGTTISDCTFQQGIFMLGVGSSPECRISTDAGVTFFESVNTIPIGLGGGGAGCLAVDGSGVYMGRNSEGSGNYKRGLC